VSGDCHGQVIRAVLQKMEPKAKALPYLELDSMMLAQVVEVAQMISKNDINSNHIQNWVRRGYLPHPEKKRYSREQVASIFLINDLRNILTLEEINRLLRFVNADPENTADDRINPVELYRYYSQTFDRTTADWERFLAELEREVLDTLANADIAEEDKERVATALIMLNLLARANLYKPIVEQWLSGIRATERGN